MTLESVVTGSNGELLQVRTNAALISAGSSLTVTFSSTEGYAMLPGLTAFGSETASYCAGYSQFPALTVEAMAYEEYVPPAATTAFGYLPFMASTGFVMSVDYCQGSASFSPLQAIGGDYAYGVVSASFPSMFMFGD
jgi:hypothetical protein